MVHISDTLPIRTKKRGKRNVPKYSTVGTSQSTESSPACVAVSEGDMGHKTAPERVVAHSLGRRTGFCVLKTIGSRAMS